MSSLVIVSAGDACLVVGAVESHFATLRISVHLPSWASPSARLGRDHSVEFPSLLGEHHRPTKSIGIYFT